MTHQIEAAIGRVEIRIVASSISYLQLLKRELRRQREPIMIIKDRGLTFVTISPIILRRIGNNVIVSSSYQNR